MGDTSVIHQSLAERHALLQKVVQPLKGRLEVLVPNGGLNNSRLPGKEELVLRSYDGEMIMHHMDYASLGSDKFRKRTNE